MTWDGANKWDGTERRKLSHMNQEDHDLLIEIHSEVKHIGTQMKKHECDIEILKKAMWGLIGAFFVVELIIKVIK